MHNVPPSSSLQWQQTSLPLFTLKERPHVLSVSRQRAGWSPPCSAKRFPAAFESARGRSGSSASSVGPPPVCLFPKHLLTHALPLVSLSEVAAPRRKERPASRLAFRTAAASLERSPSHEIFMSTCSPVHGRTLTNTNAPRARTRCVVVGLFTLEEKSSWSWQMEPLP